MDSCGHISYIQSKAVTKKSESQFHHPPGPKRTVLCRHASVDVHSFEILFSCKNPHSFPILMVLEQAGTTQGNG